MNPQGKSRDERISKVLGLNTINDVRIGKNITLQVEAGSADEAKKFAEEASAKLLANPVMEYFEISVN